MGRRTVAGPASAYIAEQLARAFEGSAFTYRSLATATGLSKGVIENAFDQEQALAVDVLVVLAKALGLNAATLVREAARAMAVTQTAGMRVSREQARATGESLQHPSARQV